MVTDFDKIYEEQYDKMYKLAYRLMANKEEAEDVLQEAFLHAYSAYPKFQNKSQISTWLYKIVVNCSYKNMKRLKRLPVYDIASRYDISKDEFFEKLKYYEPVENEVMVNSMREQCLQLFLKCIPSKQRTAFTLKVLLNLSCEDVAEIMDISVGAVKTSVYRARLRMKENMEDKCSYINPNSPCNCKNWVAYAIQNNRMDLISNFPLDKKIDYNKIFEKEMNFLSKIVFLYSKYPERIPFRIFAENIKSLISKKSLEVLS
ncbi:MAG: RNA polymerase sigma factor [Eubacteriales bacterium]|nr:RNA polymerase sigma factor [Eubacteriales bacterium]